MKLQDVADHGQDDAVRNANSYGTVEGNHLNDSSTPAAVSEIPVESQAALPGVGALENDVDTVDDVTLKDVSESINQPGVVKESQPCNLKADPCESNEVDTKVGDKQILESSDGLEGNADCAPQPTEIQNATLEDESVAVSDNTAAEVRRESEILVTNAEEAPAHEGDNSEEKVFEVKESQPCNLQADPCESIAVDTNFGDKPISESSNGLDGNADCAPQPTEIQNVALEDESVAVSDNTSAEMQPESKILVTISEEAPAHEGDNGEEKVFDVKESQSFNLQSDPFESDEVGTNFGDKPILESSDGLEGNADCAPQPTEIQNETLEDESVAVTDKTAAGVRSDSEILVTISEEAPPLEGDNGGEKVFDVKESQPCNLQADSCESNEVDMRDKPILESSDGLVRSAESVSVSDNMPEARLDSEILVTISKEAPPHEGDNEGEKVFEIKESLPFNLQVDPCESFEVDKNIGDKQILASSDGLEGNADCTPQSTDNQNVTLEDESVAVSDDTAEARSDSEILVKISEEAPPLHEGDNGGEKFFEDTRTKVLLEPKEIQDTITEPCQNGQFEVETGKKSVCGPFCMGNESFSPVLSANDDTVSDRKKCYQNIVKPETELAGEDLSDEATSKLLPEPSENNDDVTVVCENGHFDVAYGLGSEESETLSVGHSEMPCDLHPSSSISSTPVPDLKVSEPQVDLGGENILDETKMKLLQEPDDKEHAIAEVCENGHFVVDLGLGAGEPGTETVGEASSEENENHSPVLSANHSVLERYESNQHIDDSEMSSELHPSSTISNTPIVSSSCVKPETRERPDHCTENALDIFVSEGHVVDQEAPSGKGVDEVQFFENLGPENENTDALAVETAENRQYSTKDKKLEIESCVPGATMTVTDQATQSEDSTGGDTNISPPEEAAKLENKTSTSVKVDDFSCSEAHSSIEEIHGTKPVLGTTDFASEMTTLHGDELDSKSEIVLANVKSNDILRVVSNVESDFKQEKSSTILNTPFVVSSCVKPESDIREMSGQRSDVVPDIDVLHRHEVDQEASFCEEIGEVQFLRDLTPESVALGVENGHYITDDEKLEIKSCVPDAAITVINQAAEIENSAGGDTNFSSPGKIARLENMAAKTDNVDDYSCNEGLSSVEYIHGTELVFGIVDPERKTTTFHGDDLDSKNEIVLVNVKSNDVPTVAANARSDFEQENASGIGSRNVSSSDAFAPDGDLSGPVFEDNLSNLAGIVDIENKEEHLFGEDVNMNENLIFQERHDVAKSDVTLAEISDVAARNGQDMGSESLVRPFHFLVKLPRFDDTIIREQVRQAQLLVEEKTRLRDAFRLEIVNYRFNCREHASRYEAARDEARASKRAVRSKRAEIDSIQTLLNKVKNALSIEDIDARIVNLEHMIEHETLLLKEEKQFIREIKQLKLLREQLSSNLGCQDELQQALNNRDQIEGSLKALKKELDGLKECVLKAEAVARAVEKIYEGESRKLKEVQAQFEAADSVRQTAYEYMQSLRKEMYDKNQQFRVYKHDAAAAYDHATKRETEALHNLCFNQVESTMELWNNDPEFRKEYVRCNMRSAVRRLGTLDGLSLGPGEKPQVVSNSVHGGLDRMDHRPRNPSPELPAEILQQQEGQEQHNEVALTNGDSKVTEEVPKILESKTLNQGKKVHLENGVGDVSGSDIAKDVIEAKAVREEECLPNKEEQLARKAEELRKEEFKEQRRLEEKAKALEALERKKKNAEKAQLRAELRAQKEAEQKEKEKEKRQRKKERKKANTSEASDADNLGQTLAKSERVIEQTKDPDIKETSAAAVSKRSQKATKPSKTKSTIPPPLRNRGRKKLQQWIWVIITILVLVSVFIVTNVGFSSKLSINLRRSGNA